MTAKKVKSKVANQSSKQPVNFTVSGPHPLRIVKEKFGRRLDDGSISKFCESSVAKGKGCYVFVMSKRPYYVGKATKSFKQEIFNYKNVATYQNVVASVQGKPALYLVSLSSQKGKTPSSVIGQVEKLLIGLAHDANPDLKNVHHKNKEDRFVISGVYNSGRGKRPKSASAIRSVLRLAK